MLELVAIIALGLLPPLLSLLRLRRLQQRWQTQLQQARQATRTGLPSRALSRTPAASAALEVSARYLGEPSCRFNARSPHLRCAVNPAGPCTACPHYQPR